MIVAQDHWITVEAGGDVLSSMNLPDHMVRERTIIMRNWGPKVFVTALGEGADES